MKLIASRELRIHPGQVWKDLKEHREVVVTSHGRPVALMVPLRDDNIEEMLRAVRRARAMEAIRAMQEHSAKTGRKWTQADIDRVIQEVRKGRK